MKYLILLESLNILSSPDVFGVDLISILAEKNELNCSECADHWLGRLCCLRLFGVGVTSVCKIAQTRIKYSNFKWKQYVLPLNALMFFFYEQNI